MRILNERDVRTQWLLLIYMRSSTKRIKLKRNAEVVSDRFGERVTQCEEKQQYMNTAIRFATTNLYTQ